jgi:hypothetical protein
VPLQPENRPITSLDPAATICRLPFVFTILLAGIAAPFTCDTTGLGYDPLKSPDAAPFGGSAVGTSAAQLFVAIQLCNCRPATPSLAKYNWPVVQLAGIAANVPTCTGIVVLPLKFTDDPMSTVGFPPLPLPFVTVMFDEPAVIVPCAAQFSTPAEFIQHIPAPDFA